MRSPSLAFVWEIFYPSRWLLISSFLGFHLFWAWLLGTIRTFGNVDTLHFSMIQVYVNYHELWLILCPFMFERTYSRLSRYDALPISNNFIAGHLLLSLALYSALTTVSGSLILNGLFDLSLSPWNEGLFAFCATSLGIAAYLQTRQAIWRTILTATTVIGLLLFHRSLYGILYGTVASWNQPTLMELGLLFALAAIGYGWAIYGVKRSRQGETFPVFKIWSRICIMLERRERAQNFPSPSVAQFWFDWQERGWQLPSLASGVFLVSWLVWLLACQGNARGLVEGFVGGGGFLLFLGSFVSGLLPLSADQIRHPRRIGNFVASRPMSSRGLADSILQVSAASVFLTWCVWCLGTAIAFIIAWLQDVESNGILLTFILWYFPFGLFGSWGLLVTTNILLFAKPREQKVVAVIAGVLGVAILCAMFLREERAIRLYWEVLCFVTGATCFAVAIWLAMAAYRQGWVERRVGLILIAIGMVASAGVSLAWPSEVDSAAMVPLVIGGIAWSLALVPIMRMTFNACRIDSTEQASLAEI